MAREPAPAKARRYLSEGRLVVQHVNDHRVRSVCRGDGAMYRQMYELGDWRCDCPARSDGCAHLVALRLVVAPDRRNP